jgi:excisionase family DNA binding protein
MQSPTHDIETSPTTPRLSQIKASSVHPSFTPTPFEPLLTVEDAANLLTLHPVTLLRWAREGRIPHRRLGRRVVFRVSELDKWLNAAQPNEVAHAA